jgi:hypothetical protein
MTGATTHPGVVAPARWVLALTPTDVEADAGGSAVGHPGWVVPPCHLLIGPLKFKFDHLNCKTSSFLSLVLQKIQFFSKKFKFCPPSPYKYPHGLTLFHIYFIPFPLSSHAICLRAHREEVLVPIVVGKI